MVVHVLVLVPVCNISPTHSYRRIASTRVTLVIPGTSGRVPVSSTSTVLVPVFKSPLNPEYDTLPCTIPY